MMTVAQKLMTGRGGRGGGDAPLTYLGHTYYTPTPDGYYPNVIVGAGCLAIVVCFHTPATGTNLSARYYTPLPNYDSGVYSVYDVPSIAISVPTYGAVVIRYAVSSTPTVTAGIQVPAGLSGTVNAHGSDGSNIVLIIGQLADLIEISLPNLSIDFYESVYPNFHIAAAINDDLSAEAFTVSNEFYYGTSSANQINVTYV